MRTLEQIKTEMEATQAGIPELAALNSTSQISFFGLLKKMWALLVQLVEQKWELNKAEVESLLAAKRTGSASWYVEQAKAFQYGYQVSVINGVVGYLVVDPTKQIIKQAACVEDAVSGRLLIKAVKASGDNLTSLTADEITAFKAYLNEVKFAGVQIDVSSLQADKLKLVAICKYDRQVLDDNGSLLSDPSKFPVKEGIQAYLKNLPFNSVFSWTALTDYIQTIEGVKDFTVTSSQIAPAGTTLWVSFLRETVSGAGHMVLADETITYE